MRVEPPSICLGFRTPRGTKNPPNTVGSGCFPITIAHTSLRAGLSLGLVVSGATFPHPKGSVLEGKSPLFQGNLVGWNIVIWPEVWCVCLLYVLLWWGKSNGSYYRPTKCWKGWSLIPTLTIIWSNYIEKFLLYSFTIFPAFGLEFRHHYVKTIRHEHHELLVDPRILWLTSCTLSGYLTRQDLPGRLFELMMLKKR